MRQTIHCVCEYELDGTPSNMCQYHQKAAVTVAKGARDAERESIANVIETRGLAMRLQHRMDEAILLTGLAKEIRVTKRPIKVNLLKASREELTR